MKKNIFIFVLFSLLLSACYASSNSPSATSDRDLSTPSSRLVGHWKGFGDHDLFFTAVDSKGDGKMTTYNTNTGGTVDFTYFILEESRSGKNLTIMPMMEVEAYNDEGRFYEPEELLDRSIPAFEFKIAKDGLTAILILRGEWKLSYVDDSIMPMSVDVPTSDAGSGCPDGCTYQKDGCDIKGNISFDSKEKIYHVPGQKYYSDTKIDTEYGEFWFCTEEEARANGWRRSGQ